MSEMETCFKCRARISENESVTNFGLCTHCLNASLEDYHARKEAMRIEAEAMAHEADPGEPPSVEAFEKAVGDIV